MYLPAGAVLRDCVPTPEVSDHETKYPKLPKGLFNRHNLLPLAEQLLRLPLSDDHVFAGCDCARKACRQGSLLVDVQSRVDAVKQASLLAKAHKGLRCLRVLRRTFAPLLSAQGQPDCLFWDPVSGSMQTRY